MDMETCKTHRREACARSVKCLPDRHHALGEIAVGSGDRLKKRRRLDKAIARSRNTHDKHNHSHRRERLYEQRTRQHRKVANIGQDARRQAASTIAKSAGVVGESLNVGGMMRNGGWPGRWRTRAWGPFWPN